MSNANPSVIVISKVSHAVRCRTSWTEFVTEQGELLTLTEIERMYADLMRDGAVSFEDLLIVDATPSEADVAAFFVAQRAALGAGHNQVMAYCSSLFPRDLTWCITLPGIDGGGYRSADSFSEALSRAQAAVKTPDEIAADKRAAAAKLLAEAEALTAKQAA